MPRFNDRPKVNSCGCDFDDLDREFPCDSFGLVCGTGIHQDDLDLLQVLLEDSLQEPANVLLFVISADDYGAVRSDS